MSDIVKRLRGPVNAEKDYFISQWPNGELETKDAVRFEAADEIERLLSRVEMLERMDSEAATYVESVICLKSGFFTGEPPYVGWQGLGLALTQDYAEIERLRKSVASWQGIHEGAVAAMQAENDRLRAALQKINVGEGWAALIARAALDALIEEDGKLIFETPTASAAEDNQ